jgi:hypothetical protein
MLPDEKGHMVLYSYEQYQEHVAAVVETCKSPEIPFNSI